MSEQQNDIDCGTWDPVMKRVRGKKRRSSGILKSRQAFDADQDDDIDNATRTATISIIGPFERKSRRVSFANTDMIREFQVNTIESLSETDHTHNSTADESSAAPKPAAVSKRFALADRSDLLATSAPNKAADQSSTGSESRDVPCAIYSVGNAADLATLMNTTQNKHISAPSTRPAAASDDDLNTTRICDDDDVDDADSLLREFPPQKISAFDRTRILSDGDANYEMEMTQCLAGVIDDDGDITTTIRRPFGKPRGLNETRVFRNDDMETTMVVPHVGFPDMDRTRVFSAADENDMEKTSCLPVAIRVLPAAAAHSVPTSTDLEATRVFTDHNDTGEMEMTMCLNSTIAAKQRVGDVTQLFTAAERQDSDETTGIEGPVGNSSYRNWDLMETVTFDPTEVALMENVGKEVELGVAGGVTGLSKSVTVFDSRSTLAELTGKSANKSLAIIGNQSFVPATSGLPSHDRYSSVAKPAGTRDGSSFPSSAQSVSILEKPAVIVDTRSVLSELTSGKWKPPIAATALNQPCAAANKPIESNNRPTGQTSDNALDAGSRISLKSLDPYAASDDSNFVGIRVKVALEPGTKAVAGVGTKPRQQKRFHFPLLSADNLLKSALSAAAEKGGGKIEENSSAGTLRPSVGTTDRTERNAASVASESSSVGRLYGDREALQNDLPRVVDPGEISLDLGDEAGMSVSMISCVTMSEMTGMVSMMRDVGNDLTLGGTEEMTERSNARLPMLGIPEMPDIPDISGFDVTLSTSLGCPAVTSSGNSEPKTSQESADVFGSVGSGGSEYFEGCAGMNASSDAVFLPSSQESVSEIPVSRNRSQVSSGSWPSIASVAGFFRSNRQPVENSEKISEVAESVVSFARSLPTTAIISDSMFFPSSQETAGNTEKTPDASLLNKSSTSMRNDDWPCTGTSSGVTFVPSSRYSIRQPEKMSDPPKSNKSGVSLCEPLPVSAAADVSLSAIVSDLKSSGNPAEISSPPKCNQSATSFSEYLPITDAADVSLSAFISNFNSCPADRNKSSTFNLSNSYRNSSMRIRTKAVEPVSTSVAVKETRLPDTSGVDWIAEESMQLVDGSVLESSAAVAAMFGEHALLPAGAAAAAVPASTGINRGASVTEMCDGAVSDNVGASNASGFSVGETLESSSVTTAMECDGKRESIEEVKMEAVPSSVSADDNKPVAFSDDYLLQFDTNVRQLMQVVTELDSEMKKRIEIGVKRREELHAQLKAAGEKRAMIAKQRLQRIDDTLRFNSELNRRMKIVKSVESATDERLASGLASLNLMKEEQKASQRLVPFRRTQWDWDKGAEFSFLDGTLRLSFVFGAETVGKKFVGRPAQLITDLRLTSVKPDKPRSPVCDLAHQLVHEVISVDELRRGCPDTTCLPEVVRSVSRRVVEAENLCNDISKLDFENIRQRVHIDGHRVTVGFSSVAARAQFRLSCEVHLPSILHVAPTWQYTRLIGNISEEEILSIVNAAKPGIGYLRDVFAAVEASLCRRRAPSASLPVPPPAINQKPPSSSFINE